MTESLLHDIARHAAFYWQRKGLKSYTFEEMYQDAAEAALKASKVWKPERGSLRGYCFTAAKNEIRHRATRAIAPVSARGHDQTDDLGKVKGLSIECMMDSRRNNTDGRNGFIYENFTVGPSRTWRDRASSSSAFPFPKEGSPEYLDACAWQGRVRIRLYQLVKGVPNAEVGLTVLQHGLDVAVAMGYDRNQARAVAARVRRLVSNDRTLYQLAREAP